MTDWLGREKVAGNSYRPLRLAPRLRPDGNPPLPGLCGLFVYLLRTPVANGDPSPRRTHPHWKGPQREVSHEHQHRTTARRSGRPGIAGEPESLAAGPTTISSALRAVTAGSASARPRLCGRSRPRRPPRRRRDGCLAWRAATQSTARATAAVVKESAARQLACCLAIPTAGRVPREAAASGRVGKRRLGAAQPRIGTGQRGTCRSKGCGAQCRRALGG